MSGTTVPPRRSQESQQNKTFENALRTWTEIDLANVQKKLDEQGIELKADQKQSLNSRKALAQKTKEFKKLSDEQKLSELKPLLKSYQNEIDSLTSKQKKSESYFFSFYRLIAEAPDPKPLLELSLDTVLESNDSSELRAQVSHLKDELTKRADYDVLKQRLLRYEQNSAELLSSKLKAQEESFKALIDEKESNWARIEKQHQTQLETCKATIEELKTTNEVAALQLNSQNSQFDQSGPSSASAVVEISLLTRDVETWKKRVYELERRNEKLREELSASRNDLEESTLREEFMEKLSDMESENVILLANLKSAREKTEALSKESELKSQSISRDLQSALQEVRSLKERLDEQSDYEEIKQELSLMRQIEFGEDDDENDDKNLDSLLVERNRNLSRELAQHRSEKESILQRNADLEKTVRDMTVELESVKSMNTKLETDLADIQENNLSNFNDTASMLSVKTHLTRPHGRAGSLNGASSVDEASILPIITNQRDRFRDKNKALEEDTRKQQNVINELKRKNKQLQADNEELYEKTRYMASLKSNAKAPSIKQSSSLAANGRNIFTPKANVSHLENPYQTSYETKLHPIEQFRQKEQERVNSRLSPFERLFIFVTRSVLATRTTRMLFLAYCIFLHCIVMFATVHSMNLSTRMIPEVGLNVSTGGVADANVGGVVGEPSI